MAGLALTHSVRILPDHQISCPQHALRAVYHTMGAILKMSTLGTLVWTLPTGNNTGKTWFYKLKPKCNSFKMMKFCHYRGTKIFHCLCHLNNKRNILFCLTPDFLKCVSDNSVINAVHFSERLNQPVHGKLGFLFAADTQSDTPRSCRSSPLPWVHCRWQKHRLAQTRMLSLKQGLSHSEM